MVFNYFFLDLVRDSSDTENFGSEYEVEIEYDVESLSGSDINSLLDSSGDSDVSIINNDPQQTRIV